MSQRRTPLYDAHERLGARFTTFGGWDMPVEFDSIKTEHLAVRESAGKFDVSHMGVVYVGGPDATALMQRLTSNDVESLSHGESQYSMITNEAGIILDDTMVSRLPVDDEFSYLFIPNAGHDTEMVDRWRTFRDDWEFDAVVENQTTETGMIAFQGPDTEALLGDVTDVRLKSLGKGDGVYANVAGNRCWVARTGYTGEDGFELLCEADDTESVWNALDGQPCGLGSRDTLRTEMGYLLSGQDFHPETEPHTPFEANVAFTVDLDTAFVGRDALAAQHEAGVEERLVGFRLEERGIPRHGYDILVDGAVVGVVTSGTMSPSLDAAIGLGYLPVEHGESGTVVDIDVRGRSKRARIESTPFHNT